MENDGSVASYWVLIGFLLGAGFLLFCLGVFAYALLKLGRRDEYQI